MVCRLIGDFLKCKHCKAVCFSCTKTIANNLKRSDSYINFECRGIQSKIQSHPITTTPLKFNTAPKKWMVNFSGATRLPETSGFFRHPMNLIDQVVSQHASSTKDLAPRLARYLRLRLWKFRTFPSRCKN